MRNWSNNPWPALNSVPLLIEFEEIFFIIPLEGSVGLAIIPGCLQVSVCLSVCMSLETRSASHDWSQLMLSLLVPPAHSVCTHKSSKPPTMGNRKCVQTFMKHVVWMRWWGSGQLILRGLSFVWSEFTLHLSQHSLFSTKLYDASGLWKLTTELVKGLVF